MNIYLGVDGGGTKTKFLMCDERGTYLASSVQPTCHYLQCGLDGVTQVMKNGLQACLSQAQFQEADIRSVFVACAGYGDIEQDNPKIEAAVKKAFSAFPYVIGNDTENALAGSLAGKPGINVIAGTGSIGLGKDEAGNMMRCGGWHHFFGGDEGSAYWIACKLILHFTRQSDGREPKTALYAYIKDYYHFTHDSDILTLTIDTYQYDRTKIAAMSQHVYELANMQDPVALQIFKDAAKELSDMIISIYHGLSFTSSSIPISYSGGVFKSGDYILKPLQDYLSVLPSFTLHSPILPPDGGSVLLAMKQDGCMINQDIISNVKQASQI